MYTIGRCYDTCCASLPGLCVKSVASADALKDLPGIYLVQLVTYCYVDRHGVLAAETATAAAALLLRQAWPGLPNVGRVATEGQARSGYAAAWHMRVAMETEVGSSRLQRQDTAQALRMTHARASRSAAAQPPVLVRQCKAM